MPDHSFDSEGFAAAGRDRAIINIKPEHVDAWLRPDPANLTALHAIFKGERHSHCEHQVSALCAVGRQLPKSPKVWRVLPVPEGRNC